MKIIILFILSLIIAPSIVMAGPLLQDTVSDISAQETALAGEAGFNVGYTLGNATQAIIVGFLGLLGLIFIIIIIVAGFNFMTAGGDEQKVTKAKDAIRRAIIGLIIIVAAYGITYFVFMALDNIVQ